MARRSLLLASLIALPLAATAANLSSGFNGGDEGWTTPVGGTQTWQAAGGNTGGWVQVLDTDNDTNIELAAPAAWLGNWSAFLGGTLSFDAKNANGAPITYGGFGEVRITGAGGTVLMLDLAPANEPTGDQWHHYSASLTPAAGWGPSLSSVLANVTSVTITGEFQAGPGEAVGFDNIRVTAVPEPASLVLMLGGLGLVAVWRRPR
jgi:hypothetical protein